LDVTPEARTGPEAPAASSAKPAPTHTPSSLFLWVLGLSAFCLNLGYGIVIPILEDLAKRCGGEPNAPPGSAEAFTAMAVALMGFNVAKILGEVPGGIFSDRIGDRVVLSSSLLIYGISVVMLIEAQSYFPFIAARFIEGFATGVSYPAMTSVLLKHSPQNKLGRNMSIAMGAGVAGIVLGPVIASPLASFEAIGWKHDIDRPLYLALFFTLGVFSFSVAWFVKATERPKEHELDDLAQERQAVIADSVLAAAPGPRSGGGAETGFVSGIYHEFRVIARFARSPVFISLLSPLLFVKMVITAWMVLLFAHTPAVFHTARPEDTVHVVGILTGALALSIAIGTVIAGYVADRYSAKVIAHMMLVGVVATMGAFVITRSPWIFVPLFVVHCVFSAVLITIHLKMVGDLYHEDQQHGRIFGIVHALSDVGTIFGPAFVWLYLLIPGNVSYMTVGSVVTFAVMGGLGALAIPAFQFSVRRAPELPRP
jgi:MFS family permease